MTGWPPAVKLASDVKLDAYAIDHLHAFTKQAVDFSSKHERDKRPFAWEDSLVNVALALLETLTADTFEHLASTRLAISHARAELEAEDPHGPSTKAADPKEANSRKGDPAPTPSTPSSAAVVERAWSHVARHQASDDGERKRLAALVVHVQFRTSIAERTCHYRDGVYDGHHLFEEQQHPKRLDDAVWRNYGGTIVVSCHQGETHELLRPLQLAVFAAIQLKLEAHWLRDILCIRQPPEPLDDEGATLEAEMHPPDASSVHPPAGGRKAVSQPDPVRSEKLIASRWSRANFWSLLLGKGEEGEDTTLKRYPLRRSISRSLKMRKLRQTSTLDEPVDVTEKEAAAAQHKETRVALSRTRTAPATAAPLLPLGKKTVTQTPEPGHRSEPTTDEGFADSRYAKVIARMEGTVLSVSPNVRFGPPHLLERLRLQEIEDDRPPKATNTLQVPPTLKRQRSFPMADADTLADSFAEASGQLLTPNSTSSTKLSPRLPADTRAGLASLTANNASLDGMVRHQSLQYLMGSKRSDAKLGETACIALKPETVVYYRNGMLHRESDQATPLMQDQGLGEYIATAVGRAQHPCPGAACSKALIEHSWCYIHGDSRVDVSLARADSKTPFEVDREMTVWGTCAECATVFKPMILSAATHLLSFGKVLELILYDTKMQPEGGCSHTLATHFAIVRHFRYHDSVVTLRHSPVTPFELRTPTSFASDDRTDDPPSPPHLPQEHEMEALLLELDAFRTSAQRRLHWLNNTFSQSSQTSHDGKPRPVIRDYPEESGARLRQLVLETSLHALNDARFAIRQHIERIVGSIVQWEKDQLSKKDREAAKEFTIAIPSFMDSGCHALPAGNSVIAREDEPASLIAFALSSTLFRQEMAKIYAELDDPDQTYAVARKSSPSDRTSVSSLESSSDGRASRLPKDVQASSPSFEQSIVVEKSESRQRNALLSPQRSSESLASRSSRAPSGFLSRSDGSKSMQDPVLPSSDEATLLEGLLVSEEKTAPITKRITSHAVPKLIANCATPEKRPAPDVLSVGTSPTGPNFASARPVLPLASRTGGPHDAPSKSLLQVSGESTSDAAEIDQGSPSGKVSRPAALDKENSRDFSVPPTPLYDSGRSSVLSSLWPTAPWPATKGHKSLLTRSESVRKLTQNNDRKRHLKYSFRDDEKRVTVTAWDSARFGKLRRQCDIREQAFIDSLSRCTKWSTTGGKSKSAFFMTADKRFVLKQMLDAWTGSERESMLAFSSDYFNYFQKQSDAKPSLITKLYGVFSLEIRDERSGDEHKLDLVVMENLFAAHAVTHIFDLKGIATRISKTGETPRAVMWDSSWVKRYSNVVLVRAHSKAIISAAVANDSSWLAGCGIMDYSALLGVSDEEHTLILGIIDVLGSYNFAKMVEHQYAERFRRSLASYIVAIPEKWTQSTALDSRRLSLACPL